MRKIGKPYMLNLSEAERAFVDEMAWRNRMKLSEYFRGLIHAEMQKRPDIVKLVTSRMEDGNDVQ